MFEIVKVENFRFLLTTGPDFISSCLRKGTLWEKDVLLISKCLIKGILKPILIDVGANLGTWTVPMAKHIQEKDGVVFSFEPQRMVYYQLCSNCLINEVDNCYIYHSAVADYCGVVDVPVLDVKTDKNMGALSLIPEIYKQQSKPVPGKYERTSVFKLDECDIPHVDLIKIDVEGMEFDVIKGATSLLRNSTFPPVVFELWREGGIINSERKENLLRLLKVELGYHIFQRDQLCVACHPTNRVTFDNEIHGLVKI